MIDQKMRIGISTGWIHWEYAKVTLENPKSLTCEASVKNVSQHNPVALVYAKLDGDSTEEAVFKFWISPQKEEVVTLRKELLNTHNRILEIIVDEE